MYGQKQSDDITHQNSTIEIQEINHVSGFGS